MNLAFEQWLLEFLKVCKGNYIIIFVLFLLEVLVFFLDKFSKFWLQQRIIYWYLHHIYWKANIFHLVSGQTWINFSFVDLLKTKSRSLNLVNPICSSPFAKGLFTWILMKCFYERYKFIIYLLIWYSHKDFDQLQCLILFKELFVGLVSVLLWKNFQDLISNPLYNWFGLSKWKFSWKEILECEMFLFL